MPEPSQNAVRFGDAVDEARWSGVAPPERTVRDGDAPHAAGERHIRQPALLREVAVARRKQAVLPSRQEDVRELQPLGPMQGHQAHTGGIVLAGCAGRESGVVEQFAGGVEAAGEMDQLLQVLEPVLGRLCFALAEHGAVASRIQQQRELIGERRFGVSPDASDGVCETMAR